MQGFKLAVLHFCGKREMNTGFWWGNMKGKKHVGKLRHKWKDSIKMHLKRKKE